MTLRLVPPDDSGSGPDDDPSDLPPTTDAENLESRVMLNRLARNLDYVGSPGDWLLRAADSDDCLVAVFSTDAMPELAELLLRRGRP